MNSASQIAAQRRGRSPVGAAIARLSHYISANRTYYAVWSVLTLGYAGTFLAVPLLTGDIVEAIEAGRGEGVILRLALTLGAVAVVGGVLRYYSRVLVFNAARQVEFEIRNDLFGHLQKLPQSFYFRWRTGDLMSRCVNDLNSAAIRSD